MNQSSISIVKTINIDENVVFSITNTEPFTFYNITLEGNSYMTMPAITQLDSGSIAVITATINSNVNANVTAVNTLTDSKVNNNITNSNTLTDNKINSNIIFS